MVRWTTKIILTNESVQGGLENTREELGRVNFDVVYKGSWRMTEMVIMELLVAILTAETLHEFEAEVNMMKAYPHPNIEAFYGN